VREVNPHIFVADDASPFSHSTLKPFNGHKEKGWKITYLTTTLAAPIE
jgi:hypothetical protein